MLAVCRLFAFRASHPTRVAGSLLSAPHSLIAQSCCDTEEGACHEHGWGIGHYDGDQPCRVRSTRAAAADPTYRQQAESVASSTLVAHVRRASASSVAERNTHPFVHGRWMFAHNGDLAGFGAGRERLLGLVPPHLQQAIEGETDSEHAFALILAGLGQAAGSLDSPVNADTAGRVLADAVRTLDGLFPGSAAHPTKMNFLLTDGQILLACRWGHSLSWVERRGSPAGLSDGPAKRTPEYRAIAVASEPTSSEPWSSFADRSLLCVQPNLSHTVRWLFA